MELTKEELEKRIDWYGKKYGPYIEKKGLHNWKNLFRKPTLLEWTILIMLLMGLFMGWAYSYDVKQCRQVIQDLPFLACEYCQSELLRNRYNENIIKNYSNLNLSNYQFKGEDE